MVAWAEVAVVEVASVWVVELLLVFPSSFAVPLSFAGMQEMQHLMVFFMAAAN